MDKSDIEILKGLISLIKCNNGKFSKQDVVMLKGVNELLKVFNDRWITVHPHGKDAKGKHLLLKDGESPKEAIERTYGEEKTETEVKEDVIEDTPKKLETSEFDNKKVKENINKVFSGKIELVEKAIEKCKKDDSTNKILNHFEKLGKIEFKKVDLDKGCFIPPFINDDSVIKADSEYTFYHEFGHSLDCRLGKKLDKNNAKFNWLSMELTDVNKEVIEKLNYTLPKDLEKIFKGWDNKVKTQFTKEYIDSGIFANEILEKARNKYKNFDNLPLQLKSSILDDFGRKSAEKYYKKVINSNPDYKKWSVLSDVYSALTMGNDDSEKFLGKHSKEYWQDANLGLRIGKSANINSEIFANYVEMRMGDFTEQLKYLKDNEPKLYNQLDLLYNKIATEIEKL